MIVCPNCSHANPEGATNCEACYTALPATKACPSCGASIQFDATFCGQCGHSLIENPSSVPTPVSISPPVINSAPEAANIGLPPTVLANHASAVTPIASPPVVGTVSPVIPDPDLPLTVLPIGEVGVPTTSPTVESEPVVAVTSPPVATQLQSAAYHLLHLQTNTTLEIPPYLQVIHLGKPNDQSPPDIDVSGFPCSEVVSRIHANIRVDGESYYIEDLGSANGTYINHNALAKGNRHLLRSGDRISLGKGDLVTLIFQAS